MRKLLTYLMLFTMSVVVSSCSGNQATPPDGYSAGQAKSAEEKPAKKKKRKREKRDKY